MEVTMARRRVNRRNSWVAVATLVTLLAAPLSLLAQTKISYHSNKFSAQDDVKLGRQAAQEAEQQYPLLRDEQARAYVERVGQRLVSAIPAEFQHPEFHYYFKIVNASDINAFALPGALHFALSHVRPVAQLRWRRESVHGIADLLHRHPWLH